VSLISLVIANLAVLLGSHALLRRVRCGEASTDAVLFLLFRLMLISGAILLAGWTRTLTAGVLGLTGAASLAILLARGEHRHLPAVALSRLGAGVLIFGGVLVLRSLLQVWFFAPFQRDALTYHLPKIGEWIQHGGFTAEWGLDLRSSFPAGFELVETWWVVFLHHDVLIEMAGLEFLALGSVSLVAMARRLGAPERMSVLGGFLYALTPGLCLQATSCLNDGPVAALYTATAALILARVPAGLIAGAVALGVGIKGTYGYALPGLAFLFWAAGRPPSRSTLPTHAVGAVAMLIGLSWYVRNLVVFGNPIHPMGHQGILAHGTHVAQQFGPSLSSLGQNLQRAATSRMYDHLAPYDPELTHISGWGLTPFAGGLVGLFLLLRTDPRVRKIAAAYVLSLLSVFLLVVSDPWYMRYVLFFPGLFALAAAKAAESVPAIKMVALGALVVEFVATMVPGAFPVGAVTDLASMPWRQRTLYPCPTLDGLEAVGFLEEPDAEVKIYPVYRPDFSRRVVPLRATSAAGLREAMRRERLEFLFCPQGHPLLAQALSQGILGRTSRPGILQLRE
jgi:hypothetical protein